MAFWKKIFKSKYTGAEIDAAVAKAADATKVTANPTLAGTEAALTGLEVGDAKYKVKQPIDVALLENASVYKYYPYLQVGDENAFIGNFVVSDVTVYIDTIDGESSNVSTFNYPSISSIRYSDGSGYVGDLMFLMKPSILALSAMQLYTLLSTGTCTFDIEYLNNGTNPNTLQVEDCFKTEISQLCSNLENELLKLDCVSVDSATHTAVFAGHICTGSNQLAANKLVYVTITIVSNGTKWTVTANATIYSLSV